MTNFSIKLSSLLKDVKTRLEYIAGKRSDSRSEYWRIVPCDADMEILKRLAVESADLLASGFSWNAGIESSESEEYLMIYPGSMPADISESLRPLLVHALVCRIIYGWLRLAGMDDTTRWRNDFETAVSSVNEKRRTFGPLKSRPIPPL